jgi:hypothetical protein
VVAQAYLEDQPTRLYVLGMIYGVLLVMLVYNLFIYLSVRDTSYLYYILYIASFGLYQVSVNGAGILFLAGQPVVGECRDALFIGAAGLFGCQFARHFLQLGRTAAGFDRLLMALMAGGALVMVLAVTMRYGIALRMATVLALLFTVSIFSAGLYAWWRGCGWRAGSSSPGRPSCSAAGQHPDGAGLPAERVPDHVRQPDRFGAGSGAAVAGPGRPHQQPARAAGADPARDRAHP